MIFVCCNSFSNSNIAGTEDKQPTARAIKERLSKIKELSKDPSAADPEQASPSSRKGRKPAAKSPAAKKTPSKRGKGKRKATPTPEPDTSEDEADFSHDEDNSDAAGTTAAEKTGAKLKLNVGKHNNGDLAAGDITKALESPAKRQKTLNNGQGFDEVEVDLPTHSNDEC